MWGGEGCVIPDQDWSGLIVSELMYDSVYGDEYEFIELKNAGNITLKLDGLSFVEVRELASATQVTLKTFFTGLCRVSAMVSLGQIWSWHLINLLWLLPMLQHTKPFMVLLRMLHSRYDPS
jgi:hypothetical protein